MIKLRSFQHFLFATWVLIILHTTKKTFDILVWVFVLYKKTISKTTHRQKFPKKTIVFISDIDQPYVAGVVTNMLNLKRLLEQSGYTIKIISPRFFNRTIELNIRQIKKWPLPIYNPFAYFKTIVSFFDAKCFIIHTLEGTLGYSASALLRSLKKPFLIRYTTRMDSYVTMWCYGHYQKQYTKFYNSLYNPNDQIIYNNDAIMQWFNRLTFSASQAKAHVWTPTLQTMYFTPITKKSTLLTPIFLYVGRIAMEKNILDFLTWQVHGKKIVVGDGPLLSRIKQDFPSIDFVGEKKGSELLTFYDKANYFVFPSTTDTFGMVCIEAISRGLPIIGYSQQLGPGGILQNTPFNTLADTLDNSYEKAKKIDPDHLIQFAKQFSEDESRKSIVSIVEQCVK